MMSVSRIAFLGAIQCFLWVAACGGERPNSHDGHQPMLMQLSEPVLSLGGGNSADSMQIIRPVGGYRRGNQLFVVDADQHSILVYALDGTFVRRIGRLGGGPGEFRGMGPALHLRSDSIAVLDPLLWRINVFAPDGRYARNVLLSPAEYGAPVAMGEIGGKLWIVSRVRGDPRVVGEGQVFRDTLIVRSVTMDGTKSAIAAPALAGGFWRREQSSRSVRVRTVPGSGQPLIGFIATGPVINVSHQDEVFVPRNGRWEIAVATDINPPGSALRDSTSARHWAIATQDSTVWIASIDTTRQGTREWRGWTQDGLPVGRLAAPASFYIWQLGDDWVLGRRTDADDLPWVEIRRLIR